jgi:hypothetical protein
MNQKVGGHDIVMDTWITRVMDRTSPSLMSLSVSFCLHKYHNSATELLLDAMISSVFKKSKENDKGKQGPEQPAWVWGGVAAYRLQKIVVVDFFRELFPQISADDLRVEVRLHLLYCK